MLLLLLEVEGFCLLWVFPPSPLLKRLWLETCGEGLASENSPCVWSSKHYSMWVILNWHLDHAWRSRNFKNFSYFFICFYGSHIFLSCSVKSEQFMCFLSPQMGLSHFRIKSPWFPCKLSSLIHSRKVMVFVGYAVFLVRMGVTCSYKLSTLWKWKNNLGLWFVCLCFFISLFKIIFIVFYKNIAL